MNVAGLQMDIDWENPRSNFPRVRRQADLAARAGAEFLVLPEMFATGFSMNGEAVASHASRIQEFLENVARDLKIWVLAGYAVPGASRPQNACVVFNPAGEVALKYHKIHPFSHAGEDESYSAGEELLTIDADGVRVTPLICYDLRFPELFRHACDRTDLFCVIANWPEKRRDHWSALLLARAIECQSYVMGVNRVGEGNGLTYTGDSVLVDPQGSVQASAACSETLFYGKVDAAVVASTRDHFPFLRDRKPEIYANLSAKGTDGP